MDTNFKNAEQISVNKRYYCQPCTAWLKLGFGMTTVLLNLRHNAGFP